MELGFLQFLILCPMVFIAGFIDAIAGGGGLITLPAYMMVGLPPINAIATNKMSSSMGTTVTTARYIMKGYVKWKVAIVCAVMGFIGSSFGARIALLIRDDFFKIIILIILPITALYVVFGKGLKSEKEPFGEVKTIILSAIIAFFIGIYDGFYGPGTGTFLILLLGGVAHMAIREANGITKIINLCTNYAALITYLINGRVFVPIGLIAGVFNILGNYIGAKTFEKGGAKPVKPVMLVVIGIFFIKVIYEFVTK